MIVQLSSEDLISAAHVAGVIRGVKQVQAIGKQVSNHRICNQDDFGIHYAGMLGEVAVSKTLGLPIRCDVTRYGDGGDDLSVFGRTIQVKTSTHNALNRERMVIINSLDDISDIVVSCHIETPSSVDIHGFISKKKFSQLMKTVDFGYGNRCCVSANQLTPICRFYDFVKVAA